MRVAGYVRVSTAEQVEGYSIQEQTDRIQKYCESKDWDLIKVYTDGGYSGAKVDRPALQDLIANCKKYDAVVVYKLDRLSRSQKDTLYLIEDVFKKNEVAFTSMQENFDTSTPFGMAMIGILSVFAQLEREQIKERMQMGKEGKAKEGKWAFAGRAPIGYDYIKGDGGKLVINEDEAEQIRKIFELYISGMSMREVSRFMHDHYTNKYDSWNTFGNIRQTIDNPLYYGKITRKGKLYDGLHEPIISEETWQTAHAMRIRNANRNTGKQTHLLTGLLICAECGERMDYKSVNKKGKLYAYYACRNHSQRYITADASTRCAAKAWRCEALEDAVLEQVGKLSTVPQKRKEKPTNAKKIGDIERQIEKATKLYLIDNIDFDMVKKMVADLNAQKERLQAEDEARSGNDAVRKAAEDVLPTIAGVLSSGSMDAKISLLNALIDRVVVGSDTIQIYFTF